MEIIKLSNGIEMPLMGYGVFLVPANEEMTRIAALISPMFPSEIKSERSILC